MALSPQQVGRWQQAQQNAAFNPQISLLSKQMKQLGKATDPVYQAYSKILAGLPTSASVGSAYANALSNTVGQIGSTNFNAGAEGTARFASALASALGLGGAGQDVVAGLQPGAENSLVQQAMKQGAAAEFANSEAQSMSDVGKLQQEALMGQAGAEKTLSAQRQQLAGQLAGLKAKKAASAPNPLTNAIDWVRYQSAIASLNKKVSGGRGKGRGSSSGSTAVMPAAAPSKVPPMVGQGSKTTVY